MIIPEPHFTTPNPNNPTNHPTEPAKTTRHDEHTQTTHSHHHEDTTTQQPDPGHKFKCTSEGFFKDPSSERKFHQCVRFGNNLKDFVFECPVNTHYDERLHICA